MKKNLPDSLNPEYWVNSGNTGYAADAGSGASISRMIMKLFAGIVAATVVTTALVFVGSYYNAGNVANAARVIGTHHQKNQEPSKDSVQTEEEEEELEEQTYSDGMENTDKAEHVSSDARKSSVSDVSENDMTGSHESESRESMDFRGKTSKKFKKSESQTKVLSNDPYDADARDPAGPNVVRLMLLMAFSRYPSKPATATSCGTRMPPLASDAINASAIISLAQTTASGMESSPLME